MKDEPAGVMVALKQVNTEVAKAWKNRTFSKQILVAMLNVLMAIFYAMVRVFKKVFFYIFTQLQKLLPLPV